MSSVRIAAILVGALWLAYLVGMPFLIYYLVGLVCAFYGWAPPSLPIILAMWIILRIVL